MLGLLKVVMAVFGVTGLTVAVPLGVVMSRGGGVSAEVFDYKKYCPSPRELNNRGIVNPMYAYTVTMEDSLEPKITYDETDVEFVTCFAK